MAHPTRHRLSFVGLTHPQVWNKLHQYTQVTLTLTELSSCDDAENSCKSFRSRFSYEFY